MTQRIDRIADDYFVEVGKVPTPTHKQEVELFTKLMVARSQVEDIDRRLKRRDEKSKENLLSTRKKWEIEAKQLEAKAATGYLRFVIKKARKYTTNPDLLQEIIGYGNIGLMDAVQRFDVTRNWRFLTYASWWIRARIQEFLHGHSLVHMPVQVLKNTRKQRRNEEVEMALGLRRTYSIEEPSSWHVELDDIAEAYAPPSDEARMLLRMSEACLSARKKLILLFSFGMGGTETRTSEEITELLYCLDGVFCPPEEIRKIKESALVELRRASENW